MLVVRPLITTDWPSLKALRLHALRTEAGRFFRHVDEESGLPDEHWSELATGDEKRQVFGLFDAGRLVGMSAVYTDWDDPAGETAGFGMMYILPEYRGRDLAATMYEARIAWVKARPKFKRAAIGHRRSNEASRRLIERFGFTWTRDLPHHWPDGTDDDDVCYEMRL